MTNCVPDCLSLTMARGTQTMPAIIRCCDGPGLILPDVKTARSTVESQATLAPGVSFIASTIVSAVIVFAELGRRTDQDETPVRISHRCPRGQRRRSSSQSTNPRRPLHGPGHVQLDDVRPKASLRVAPLTEDRTRGRHGHVDHLAVRRTSASSCPDRRVSAVPSRLRSATCSPTVVRPSHLVPVTSHRGGILLLARRRPRAPMNLYRGICLCPDDRAVRLSLHRKTRA